MKAMLSYINAQVLIGQHPGLEGDCTGLEGDCSGLEGNCSGLKGDCSGLRGDCSGLKGNFDACEITRDERETGVNVCDLVAAPTAPRTVEQETK